jgi:hypothetical protein
MNYFGSLLASFLEWATGWRIYRHIEELPYSSSAQDLADQLDELEESAVVQVETYGPGIGAYLTYDFTLDVFERPTGVGEENQTVAVIKS